MAGRKAPCGRPRPALLAARAAFWSCRAGGGVPPVCGVVSSFLLSAVGRRAERRGPPPRGVADTLAEGYARRPMPPLLRVHEATLRNGLRVRVVPSSETPVVSLYTFFRVGSRNERPGLTGISHLFEHMMFNGAEKYGPHQFDEVLESHGGRSNAYTSHDLTVYYDEFASEALEQVLDSRGRSHAFAGHLRPDVGARA